MKQIKIIDMGGTISAQGKDRLDLKDYQSGVYNSADFLEALPELRNIANITFDSFLNVSSTKITSEHWIQLRNKIIRCFDEETCDGIVITHGTSTIEETAYFLHLTIPFKKPIVIVGAQRPYSAISSDAQLNLLQAVRVAASNEATGKGVLVVTNDEINCAREVTKTDTYRVETFQSSQFGFLGVVDPDKTVQFYRSPTRRHTVDSIFSKLKITELPNVEIVYSYAGASGFLIEAITKSRQFQGVVIAGTGAGLVSPAELKALRDASKQGIFIVRSSRGGSGRVMAIKPYENDSFISGDNLLPQKARILLMLSLLLYDDVNKIQEIFNQY